MAGELPYRQDLFKGTAEYYDRFRPPYPAVLLDDLRARVPIRSTTRVLDLACGTGQIAFALAADVAEVWAVDQEAGSIEFGKRQAERLGVTNIQWIAAPAEDVVLAGAFDLVAVGNAFHRLDRAAVARRLVPHLPEHGCFVLVWGGTPWPGDRQWQRVLVDTQERFSAVERWSVESLIGFVYSTSFLNRAVLHHHADAFANDLRRQLLACRPDGVFEQDLTFAYELARRAT